MIIPHQSALLRPCLGCCAQLQALQCKGDLKLLGGVQQRAIKVMGQELLSCEERLRELSLVSPEERRLRGNLINVDLMKLGKLQEKVDLSHISREAHLIDSHIFSLTQIRNTHRCCPSAGDLL